jgi:hypothetical protein
LSRRASQSALPVSACFFILRSDIKNDIGKWFKTYKKGVIAPRYTPEFDVFRLTQQLLEALERM